MTLTCACRCVCRLVHPLESMVMGLGDGSSAMLLLGFESSTVTDFTASMKAW